MKGSLLEFKNNKLEDAELLINCPVCQTSFNKRNALIVYDNGKCLLIHIDCVECAGSVLLRLKKSQVKEKYSVVVCMTDLTKEDTIYFREKSNLSSSEILKVHRFFKNNHPV